MSPEFDRLVDALADLAADDFVRHAPERLFEAAVDTDQASWLAMWLGEVMEVVCPVAEDGPNEDNQGVSEP